MIKIVYLLCFHLILCLPFGFNEKGNKQDGSSAGTIKNKKKSKNHTWKKYGTFDEFKLKGVDCICDSSVFVKDCGDSIIVRKSSNMDSVIVYRKSGDYWENHIYLDFERDNRDYLAKSSFDLPPRIYDRYLIGDTLVEMRSFFFPNDMIMFFYLIVKPSSYDKVYRIDVDSKNPKYYPKESLLFFLHNPFSLNNVLLLEYFKKDPRRVLKILANPQLMDSNIKVEVTEYSVSKDAEYIYYSAPDEILIAKKSPYGIFGLQPGFDCFYNQLWTPWDMKSNEEELKENIQPPPEYRSK